MQIAKIGLSFSLLLMVAGCASNSAAVAPAYVSPMVYEGYTCNQLFREGQRISTYAARAAGEQDNAQTNDAIMTGIALVVFWPAVFAIQGDGGQTAELARLKGERDAIERQAILQNCDIKFHQAQKVSRRQSPADRNFEKGSPGSRDGA